MRLRLVIGIVVFGMALGLLVTELMGRRSALNIVAVSALAVVIAKLRS